MENPAGLRQIIRRWWLQLNGFSTEPAFMIVRLHSFGVDVLARIENRRLGPAAFDTKEEALKKASSMGSRWRVRQYGQKFYICQW